MPIYSLIITLNGHELDIDSDSLSTNRVVKIHSQVFPFQTDRQTHRQKDRQTHKKTDRWTDRHTERQTDTQTDGRMDG